MTKDELYEFEQRVGELPPGEQIRVIERLIRRLRQGFFTDHAAIEKDIEAMAADPDIQRAMGQEVRANEAG